jgi:hypothetical protein
MAMPPQQRMQIQPNSQRSGRQLVAFVFTLLSVGLMILACWLAIARVGRLLHWSKADAEVLHTDVYLGVQGRGTRRSTVWGAGVTIQYVANGQSVATTVDRGFQTAIRLWMEQWTRQYPAGSHRKILFNPADPWEADLDGEWSLASFSSPIEFGMVSVLLFWASRRLGGSARGA